MVLQYWDNVREMAGQSIFHVHIHLIPRYKGDMKNPKGGVRHIIRGEKGITRIELVCCVLKEFPPEQIAAGNRGDAEISLMLSVV